MTQVRKAGMANGEGTVRSAERVASLLELLRSRKTSLRRLDIANSLDIPMSSAHGLLHALVTDDFVDRDKTQRYRWWEMRRSQ